MPDLSRLSEAARFDPTGQDGVAGNLLPDQAHFPEGRGASYGAAATPTGIQLRLPALGSREATALLEANAASASVAPASFTWGATRITFMSNTHVELHFHPTTLRTP